MLMADRHPLKYLVAIALCSVVSCQSKPKSDTVGANSETAPTPTDTNATKHYGAVAKGAQKTTLATIAKAPTDFAGKTVKLSGQVRKACSTKGCWMEITDTKGADETACRVTFKDYSFFVPTDSAGADATVEGTVVLKTIKASHVEHLESEGATFKNKNADGSALEVRIVATSVTLTR